ncbi:MAG: N-formylglutamate amidohydrolase [Bdellovibrionota bacterium]
MTSKCYRIRHSRGRRLPILLSSPHSGIEFPLEVGAKIKRRYVELPEDTDFFIDQLYDFGPAVGMTQISALYSRYVIDLNRDPSGSGLYADGRSETGLVPVKTFSQQLLYEYGCEPTEEEISRRLDAYYWPYYHRVERELQLLKHEFGEVIFFDCHSIKRVVKSIRSEPFPDLIVGTLDGKTVSTKLQEIFIKGVSQGGIYQVSNNIPFKGGHLTRYFGKPSDGVHAIQLEMSQDIYLNEDRSAIDEEKAQELRRLLKESLLSLVNVLLNDEKAK